MAKGAVYHHFQSKEQIFERVFEQMTGALAAEVAATAAAGKSTLDRFERGTLKYLTSIAGNKFRQVLLIDGPSVLGWEKWREIDTRHFGGVMKAPMRTPHGRVSAREMAAIGHLIAGAVSETAAQVIVDLLPEHRLDRMTRAVMHGPTALHEHGGCREHALAAT